MVDFGYTVRGDLLRYYRMRRHLSQQELAEQSGLSLGQINRIENGKIRSPHLGTIKKLAGALGIDPDQLIVWDAVKL